MELNSLLPNRPGQFQTWLFEWYNVIHEGVLFTSSTIRSKKSTPERARALAQGRSPQWTCTNCPVLPSLAASCLAFLVWSFLLRLSPSRTVRLSSFMSGSRPTRSLEASSSGSSPALLLGLQVLLLRCFLGAASADLLQPHPFILSYWVFSLEFIAVMGLLCLCLGTAKDLIYFIDQTIKSTTLPEWQTAPLIND